MENRLKEGFCFIDVDAMPATSWLPEWASGLFVHAGVDFSLMPLTLLPRRGIIPRLRCKEEVSDAGALCGLWDRLCLAVGFRFGSCKY